MGFGDTMLGWSGVLAPYHLRKGRFSVWQPYMALNLGMFYYNFARGGLGLFIAHCLFIALSHFVDFLMDAENGRNLKRLMLSHHRGLLRD